MKQQLHIAFVGGGTAGHIAPLLAVMEACQILAKNEKVALRCSYIGLAADLKSSLITESSLDFETYAVRSGKMHRHLTLDHFKQARNFVGGLRDANRIVKQLMPDIIFAKGGYTVIPVALAARRRNIPIYGHESDAVPGLANRIVARMAKIMFTAYPASVYTTLPGAKVRSVGQPVRKEFYQREDHIPPIHGRRLDPSLPVVTIIGGSQGARAVNTLVRGAYETLLEQVQLVHITGKGDYPSYVTARNELSALHQDRLFIVDFLTHGVPALFQKSAVVISRSGGTIAELAASRAAAVLIPLPTSAQQHQKVNADIVAAGGGAVVLEQKTTTPSTLSETVLRIVHTLSEQTALRAAIGQFDHPDAAEHMAAILMGKDY